MTNTIGFWYKEHVLTCIPKSGSIVRFKKHLFLQCQIIGEITRLDKNGKPTEFRPKIFIEDLTILSDKEQPGLSFGEEEDD